MHPWERGGNKVSLYSCPFGRYRQWGDITHKYFPYTSAASYVLLLLCSLLTGRKAEPRLQTHVSWVPVIHSLPLASHSQESSAAEALLKAMRSSRLAGFPCVSPSGLLPQNRTSFERPTVFCLRKKTRDFIHPGFPEPRVSCRIMVL